MLKRISCELRVAICERSLVALLASFLIVMVGGCSSRVPDTMAPGPLDKGLFRHAINQNNDRLAGEGTSYAGSTQLWDVMWGNTANKVVQKMLSDDADVRRAATLKLADYGFARRGPALKEYARMANDPDYTVRAAGLRALNRSRAKGFTTLYLQKLNDPDQPLVRLEAADCLSNVPDPTAVSQLIKHMQAEVSEDVRIACAESLRNYHTIEVGRALANELGDPSFSVAWQARQSLELLTGQDYLYNSQAWLTYISTRRDWE